MYSFFPPDEEELKNVIKETLTGEDVLVSAETIQTGWTNITMDVKGELRNYIFRFPRNLFFARMMVKDCTFCNFLKIVLFQYIKKLRVILLLPNWIN